MVNLQEKLSTCIEQLLREKRSVYAAASVDELTDALEEISLKMEECNQDFSFSIDGVTVTLQLH
jgi:hypothetical protein